MRSRFGISGISNIGPKTSRMRRANSTLTRAERMDGGVRPILLKNYYSRAAGQAREKSTSQIALQADREHRLGVR